MPSDERPAPKIAPPSGGPGGARSLGKERRRLPGKDAPQAQYAGGPLRSREKPRRRRSNDVAIMNPDKGT